MTRLISLGLLVSVLWLPTPGQAQDQPSRTSVRRMLSGIEHTPTDQDLQRLGPQALPILMTLYNDLTEPAFVRARALDATAAFPRPAVRTFLLAAANAEGQSDLFIRRALLALARGFGREVSTDLAGFLGHDQPVVREAAARSLGRVGGAPAVRALRAQLRREQDPTVRATLEAAIEAATE